MALPGRVPLICSVRGSSAVSAWPPSWPTDCRVLVCDEPTYAQDRTNTMAVMDELCRTARSRRAALIFSTHDRQLAEDYGDVVLRLEGGKLHEAAQSRG